jgi:hypothetical protein
MLILYNLCNAISNIVSIEKCSSVVLTCMPAIIRMLAFCHLPRLAWVGSYHICFWENDVSLFFFYIVQGLEPIQ